MPPRTLSLENEGLSYGGKGPLGTVVSTACITPDAPRAYHGGVLPTRDGVAGATTTIYSNVGAGIAVAT